MAPQESAGIFRFILAVAALPCALQADVLAAKRASAVFARQSCNPAKSHDTTVTNRTAGNCDFDSLAAFTGGEWQFVADHRAAIDRVTDLGIRRRGSAHNSRSIYPVRIQPPTPSRSGLVEIATDSSYPRLQRHATMLHIVFLALHGR